MFWITAALREPRPKQTSLPTDRVVTKTIRTPSDCVFNHIGLTAWAVHYTER